MIRAVVAAFVLQLVAQQYSGVWGAAVAGVITGIVLRAGRAGRTAALTAAAAAAFLLLLEVLQGAALGTFADMVGKNFALPGWVVVVATLLLPALQAGGMAAGVSRVVRAFGGVKPTYKSPSVA